jgi:hypothetical protein
MVATLVVKKKSLKKKQKHNLIWMVVTLVAKTNS